jgi:Periplasmic copper-binding protein (NosD)
LKLADFVAAAVACALVLSSTFGQGTPGTLFSAPAAPIGAPHAFRIQSGTPNAPYVFDLSTFGTSPGFSLGPGAPVVPLNRPWVWIDFLGAAPSPLLSGFSGTTDAAGRAAATIHVPPLPQLVGGSIDGCAATLSPGAPFGIGVITNPVHLVFVSADASLPPGPIPPYVPPAPPGAANRFVSPTGSDANDGLSPQTAWRQIAKAATVAFPGMIVDIADGAYAGPVLMSNDAGTQAAPIVYRATGNAAILTGSANNNNDDRNSIFIGSSSHVVIHGLKVFASLRSGARVSLSHHVTIQGCVFGNHQKWGIFTDYADDLSLLGNECYGSIDEHGIYHSNSGDRAVIAGNWCHDNKASGIQINADPDFLDPIGGYVPDGISFHCVVERNFLQDNGQLGGAAINLASIRNCVIRNNVIVNDTWINSTGIALWDNAAGIQWGCKDNLIEHNTVAYTAGKGRYAITFMNGSTGNVIRDNVLRGGRRGALSFTADSLAGFSCDYNVFFSVDNWPIIVQDDVSYVTYTLAQWQGLGFDAHSIHANPAFANEPAGNLGLLPGSAGRDTGLDTLVPIDVRESSRPASGGYDMGAYEE